MPVALRYVPGVLDAVRGAVVREVQQLLDKIQYVSSQVNATTTVSQALQATSQHVQSAGGSFKDMKCKLVEQLRAEWAGAAHETVPQDRTLTHAVADSSSIPTDVVRANSTLADVVTTSSMPLIGKQAEHVDARGRQPENRGLLHTDDSSCPHHDVVGEDNSSDTSCDMGVHVITSGFQSSCTVDKPHIGLGIIGLVSDISSCHERDRDICKDEHDQVHDVEDGVVVIMDLACTRELKASVPAHHNLAAVPPVGCVS